jgi:hypothetical protein
MKTSEMILENGQSMIDGSNVFEFNEVEGDVKLVDGIMAGEPYYGFEFVSGPHAGKTIYCTREWGPEEVVFRYDVDDSSDGMNFNLSPEQKKAEDDDGAGDFILDLDMQTFTIKGE